MRNADKNISSTDTPSADRGTIRVLLAAGGTGGHVYPAIAIADSLREMDEKANIIFVGTKDRMEWTTVPKSGYNIKSVWISGFHRRLTIQNLLFPLKLIVSLIQSYFILRSFRPGAVVACGGFASGPVAWVAAKIGIPLILQEQNSFPGATNRMLAKHAAVIFTAFEDAQNYFPKEKIKLSGNPVRSQLQTINRKAGLDHFDFVPGEKVLMILGGSGGALAINNAVENNLDVLHNGLGLQIIWQCGKKYYEQLSSSVQPKKYPNLRLLHFIEDMASAYAAADLVITRAGASTCSELMLLGQPAVFVPSPNVAGNHQEKNARSMVKAGAAELLKEENLDNSLTEIIEKLITDRKQLEQMSKAMKKLAKPEAANTIAKEVYTIAERKEE